VSTDLLSHGIDEAIALVIMMRPPYDMHSYVAKAGRAGRLNHPGIVCTLATRAGVRKMPWLRAADEFWGLRAEWTKWADEDEFSRDSLSLLFSVLE